MQIEKEKIANDFKGIPDSYSSVMNLNCWLSVSRFIQINFGFYFCLEKCEELRAKDLQLKQIAASYETVQKEKQHIDNEFFLLKQKYKDLMDLFNLAIGQRNSVQSTADALKFELESLKTDTEIERYVRKGLYTLYSLCEFHVEYSFVSFHFFLISFEINRKMFACGRQWFGIITICEGAWAIAEGEKRLKLF